MFSSQSLVSIFSLGICPMEKDSPLPPAWEWQSAIMCLQSQFGSHPQLGSLTLSQQCVALGTGQGGYITLIASCPLWKLPPGLEAGSLSDSPLPPSPCQGLLLVFGDGQVGAVVGAWGGGGS